MTSHRLGETTFDVEIDRFFCVTNVFTFTLFAAECMLLLHGPLMCRSLPL